MDGPEEAQVARRFNPFRTFSRGLKAACRWTIGLGRGRLAVSPGRRAGPRRRRWRGTPPLASLSAAMLDHGEALDMGDDTYTTAPSACGTLSQRHHLAAQLALSLNPSQLLADASASGGSVFPLVLPRSPQVVHTSPGVHQQCRSLRYHIHAEDHPLHAHHHHSLHRSHHRLDVEGDDNGWLHYHSDHQSINRTDRHCTCGNAAAGARCDPSLCPGAGFDSTSGCGGLRVDDHARGTRPAASTTDDHDTQARQQQPQRPCHSLQRLLAVGSRQWGGGGWWDGRGLLRVKIYDFAIYADPNKAAQALCSATTQSRGSSLRLGTGAELGLRRESSASGGPGGSSTSPANCSSDGTSASAAELLASPSCGVEASLVIRACRNLPLSMLSQEFERILQRRHEKAGGRPDDPALRELLSYFSRDRLPPHVVTAACSGAEAGDGVPGGGGDAVRKGAAITFSRSSTGDLVTEAGGRVLGRVSSPPLAAALFDLYLGDQPVSKKAKAAAGAAMLRLADESAASVASSSPPRTTDPLPVRYQLQPGERLVCPPGVGPGRGTGDVSACVLELL